jgi:hypothetical protein
VVRTAGGRLGVVHRPIRGGLCIISIIAFRLQYHILYPGIARDSMEEEGEEKAKDDDDLHVR